MLKSPVVTGDVLKGQYEVGKTLGQGGFGAVFEVHDRKSQEKLALKVELQRPPEDEPGLELEIGVLKRLQRSQHATKYIDEGKVGPFRYVIMQLVGKNLGDLRRCNKEFRFTLPTSTRVAVQCLEAIEDVHKIGMLHRDIKPANYAIGRTPVDIRIIYILDFGMVRRFLNKDGSLRPARPIAGFRGKDSFEVLHFIVIECCHLQMQHASICAQSPTAIDLWYGFMELFKIFSLVLRILGTARYASMNAHQNNELGRHDDLWSWLYMVIEMHQGELPWRAEANKENIGKMKEKLSRHTLLKGMETEYHHIHDNLKTLKYEVEPNYQWIHQCLQHVMQRKRISPNDPFDWEKGGVGYAKAKTVAPQPYGRQMEDQNNQVKEKHPDEQTEESDDN